MKKTIYHAHATRNNGKETVFDMKFDEPGKAAITLADILYMELGNGEGDLRERHSEIIHTLYNGLKYSYADCEFWIDAEEAVSESQDYVWVLIVNKPEVAEMFNVYDRFTTLVADFKDFLGRPLTVNEDAQFVTYNKIKIGGMTFTAMRRAIRKSSEG